MRFAQPVSPVTGVLCFETKIHQKTLKNRRNSTKQLWNATRSLPVHPTQIYSTINAALIAWLLWAFFPFRSRDGEVVALMLTVYPISRFLLEMIRTDEIIFFGTGMSISQNLSVVLIVAALIGWGVLRTKPPQLALPAQ